MATSNAGAGANTSSNANDFTRTRAATPCGVSLGTALAKTSSGSSSASVCADNCGSSLCTRSLADSLKKTVSEPQSAADRLFHDVHAFHGNLALRIGCSLGESAAQLLHARILAAVDAAQTIFDFDGYGHGA